MSRKLYEAPLKNLKDVEQNYADYQRSCIYKLDLPDSDLHKIGACHGAHIKSMEAFKPENRNEFFLYIPKDLLAYSLTDLKRWLRFLGYCGFKFHYLGEEFAKVGEEVKFADGAEDDEDYDEDYDEDEYRYEGDCYVLKLKCAEYKNNMHIFAALTAMRYIYYQYDVRFLNIPEAIFNLKNIFKDKLDGIQLFQLAFHCTNNKDDGHAFIGSGAGFSTFISKKKFYNKISKIENDGNSSLNSCLYEKRAPSLSKLSTYYSAKDMVKELKEEVIKNL